MVQSDLDSLSTCCDRMGSLLASSRTANADLLHDLDRLQRALGASEARSGLVTQFLDQYQLAPGEVAALQVRCALYRAVLCWGVWPGTRPVAFGEVGLRDAMGKGPGLLRCS